MVATATTRSTRAISGVILFSAVEAATAFVPTPRTTFAPIVRAWRVAKRLVKGGSVLALAPEIF